MMQTTAQRSFLSSVWQLIAAVVLLHLLWWLASMGLGNHRLLPAPLEVYAVLPKLVSSGLLHQHLSISLFRLLVALVVATLLGLLLVVGGYHCKRLQPMFDGLIYFTYPVPKLILLPVVMILCGIGDVSKIVMIILVILLPIMVTLRDALRQIPQAYLHVFSSLRASRRLLTCHLLLPVLFPALFSALRIALGTAISVLFVAETYGTDRGLGYLITDLWMRLQYTEMYATILLLAFVGLLLFLLVDVPARYLLSRRYR